MASSDAYTATVRLLLRVLPVLQGQQVFALKGGTAINLFHQDLPRLSVDIDLAYLGVNSRAQALAEIHTELSRMAGVLTGQGLQVRGTPLTGSPGSGEWIKLVVSDGRAQVKVEVSPVLRGAVFPAEVRQTSPAVQARFGFAEVPVLALPDLYAGKLVAALDRQHPRDLFDVHHFLGQGLYTREVHLAFLVYLISHGRPIHEVLRPNLKDIRGEYDRAFKGMAEEDIPITTLEQARSDLIQVIHASLTDDDRAFLLNVAAGEPEWDRLPLPGVANLPAVQWKLHNIGRMTRAKKDEALQRLREALTAPKA